MADSGLGYWISTVFDQGGHELLLVSDLVDASPPAGPTSEQPVDTSMPMAVEATSMPGFIMGSILGDASAQSETT
jgi:hypothetical protein